MRKGILWIDDEIEFLRSHINFLESRGYDVTPADSGGRAVRLIEENRDAYDIVLLDRQMPVKSGIVTLDEIKRIAPELPIVMLTGYQHKTDMPLAGKIDGCLTKPADPAMILQECQRIIDSRQKISGETAARYARACTENQTRLKEPPSASGFISLCRDIALWDIEIEGAMSESMRQMHAGIKHDTTKAFCSYVAENYPGWIRGRAGRSMLPTDIVEKAVIPELKAGRGVVLISVSGLRLDQFLSIEPDLKKNFAVSRAMFLSLLPTAPEFGMPSLASGLFPDELYGAVPELYNRENAFRNPVLMARAMTRGLGGTEAETFFADICADGARARIKEIIDAAKNKPVYAVIYFDAMKLIINSCQAGDPDAVPPAAPARDGATLRSRARGKLLGSGIFEIMNAACLNSCAAILTSDHGHIYSDRPAVIYESDQIGSSLRHTFAREAAGDERAVLVVEDPAHFRLPPRPSRPKCLMARENYYFTLAEKYGGGKQRRGGALRYGGLSPEEMIMPVYVCRHRSG